jgi:hypothetical protein
MAAQNVKVTVKDRHREVTTRRFKYRPTSENKTTMEGNIVHVVLEQLRTTFRRIHEQIARR